MYRFTSFVIMVDSFIFLVLVITQATANVLRNETVRNIDMDVVTNDGSVIVQNGSGFLSLANLKAFLEVAGNGKSLGGKWLRSQFSSFLYSTSGIRVVEFIEQMRSAMLERIKSSAGDIVKARSESGWHGGLHSLEGALLSLAFLTFAVFLINFIQQFVTLLRTGLRTPLLGRRKRRNIKAEPLAIKDTDSEPAFSTLTSTVLAAIENPLFSKKFNVV